MDCHLNLEFLCRVCAANTKGKNSVAEGVYILKTIGLRDKLDKFLYLKVFENDALPKALCKSCYRQVEATASLSKIAKHTQQVFRDFLFSTLPKGTVTGIVNSSEFCSSDFSSNKNTEKPQVSELTIPPAPANSLAQVTPPPPPLAPTLQTIPALTTTSTPNTTPRKDEVVVNVSVSDPLTRENQQKVISNSQRRHSIMVEAAEIAAAYNPSLYYVPKTIAQKQQKPTNTSGNSRKSSSPARVLKFHPIAPKPLEQQANKQATQQQSAQVTTFSSGGYVIGPAKATSLTTVAKAGEAVGQTLNTSSSNKEESSKSVNPLVPSSNSTVKDNTILQQKRKNLVKALNNIKANSTGQVSLLKSSQQKQQQQQSMSQQETVQQQQHQLAQQQSAPGTKSPLNAMAHVPDELPDKIIIAAPKNKGSTPQRLDKTKDNSVPSTNAMVSSNSTVVTEKSSSITPAPKPSFPEDILLGRVIRDVDLLKLILKALKWPTNKQNMELQLQRLKTSRFTDVMSDSNLLQDTDLTQLLGPYLAPVLMAAQALQQQQNQIMKNVASSGNPPASTSNSTTTTTSTSNLNSMHQNPPQRQSYLLSNLPILDDSKDDINKAMPYKLPPETSVQLVPALPEDSPNPTATNSLSTITVKRSISSVEKAAESCAKRQRKSAIQKHRDSIVISDEEDNIPLSIAKQRAASKSVSNNFPVDITNPAFLAQLGLLNGGSRDKTNEALLALLQKQKLSATKQQQKNKSKRLNITLLPPSEFDALINIDEDIVLMEPVTTSPTPTSYNTIIPISTISGADALNSQPIAQTSKDIFALPSQTQNPVPLITRPIIKRRKTVIQSAKVVGKQQSLLCNSLTTQPSHDTANKQTANQNNIESGSAQNQLSNTPSVTGKDIQLPAKLSTLDETAKPLNASDYSKTSGTETTTSKQGNTSLRKQQYKAALGQHLLEAIGLRKLKQTNTLSKPTEAPSSSTNPAASATVVAATKLSLQQIRSALKKSLKQAQEQQELRNKEISTSVSTTTVIQDADSTTKSTIKEIVIEGKSDKNSGSSTSFVDVEEQIDKIALVRNQSATKTVGGAGNVGSIPSDKEETKTDSLAVKKSAPGRITERRSTLPTSMGRVRPKAKQQEPPIYDKDKASETKIREQQEKIKTDTAVASSSKVSSSSATTTEVTEDVVATPRRRARKRYTEQVAPEAPTNTDSGKDNEKAKEIANEQKNEAEKYVPSEKEIKKDKDKDSEKESCTDNEKHKEIEKFTKQNEEKSKSIDQIKEGTEDTISNSGRPTRQSKTLSKYYKGPDKPATERRSLPARSTRNRKYT